MSTLEELARWPDCRSFLDAVRRGVGRLGWLHDVIAYGADAVQPTGGGGSGPSDPTASRALMESAVVDAAKAEASRVEDMAGAALVLAEGVRLGLGDRYADVLERHYVGGLSFAETAEEMGVSKAQAVKLRDVACDWVDFVGWNRAIRGLGGSG